MTTGSQLIPQAMAASDNPLLQEKNVRDPHLFATGYNKSRFYLFGRGDQ